MDTIEDPCLRHLFDGDPVFNVYNQEVANLSVGAPGPDLLQHCVEVLNKSTQHRLEEEKKEGKYYLFQYGITAGLWECRDELAKFLSRRYGNSVAREHLILTCGASHGLQLLLNTVLSPNGIIFVEEVTYMIALDVFKQFPLMRIITVPMKDDVVNLDAFEKIVAEERTKGNFFLSDQKIFWAMFYTIPIFHNPTGMTLSADQCKRLVEIARNNSILVTCDDVYNLLYYGQGLPPRRLIFYDESQDPSYRGGNVVSNCSFSKILSPAIRFGWLECSPRVVNIIKTCGILRSGGGVNHYVSGIITSMLHENIEDEYLDKIIEIYRERLNALCATLDRFLPSCCSYRRPGGGYFVWIHLPSGIDSKKFVEWCQKEYKVSAIPGSRFSHTSEAKNYLRISIGFHTKEVLETASQTLCKALLTYIRHQVGYDNNAK
ncbi:PREDICTED: 2-aminoadipate transaminase-like [Dinoponera quadriceps]|uniref:2-aminoadipate transaminase-like n=1 Tax=Dinoponera quadriceps TaxID=609295 RepID=A0A6P3WYX5_DINQU|nr:PREDICTED: 2-aminoadipate transaminase-like [Dinoponera quadriceps]XP_014471264.1 PREDICTED: 2-aminoadipate transaminase-like [Dinoponera quadriceps]XP_014471265.1 PREDICTED: 2-aminoadipate transaminase-like [Dinoponera quadriceps]